MTSPIINNYKNAIVAGSDGRNMLVDLQYMPGAGPKPLLIFAHGFKGFKDWGHWIALFEKMVYGGFSCLRFNFSHNGVNPKSPADLSDMDAFRLNNYSKECFDLNQIINWAVSGIEWPADAPKLGKIGLIGHSRGGPIVLLQAARDQRIGAVATWASVHSLDYSWKNRDEASMLEWKKKGVDYVLNSRTGQKMPIDYQLVEDFNQNKEKLDTQDAVKSLRCPGLIVHGTADPAVPVADAYLLKSWQPALSLSLIEGGDHVFDGRHPFNGQELPKASLELVKQTTQFFNKHLFY